MRIIAILFFVAVSQASYAQNFDLQAVENLAQQPDVHSVEDFLAKTPDFMKIGSALTLAYHPHGLIPGSFEWPLIYLYGDERSNVVLAFSSRDTGSSPDANFMEVLSFDPLTKTHHLARITFSPPAQPSIERQPQSCTACHGEHSKPLWRAGYAWEGFFGSNVDSLDNSDGAGDERAAMANLIAKNSIRLKDLDLAHAYSTPSSQSRGNNNILLAARLAIEHTADLANRFINSPNYHRENARLLYELSLCDDSTVESRENALSSAGISPQEWYMNIEAKPNPGTDAYYGRDGQSFEYGLGPIEYLMLSQILAADPANPLNSRFSRYITSFYGSPNQSAESILKPYCAQMPDELLAPMPFGGSPYDWCTKFRNDFLGAPTPSVQPVSVSKENLHRLPKHHAIRRHSLVRST